MRMTKKEMISDMIATFEKQLVAFTGRKIRLLVVDYNKADESHLSRPEIKAWATTQAQFMAFKNIKTCMK